MYNGCLNCPPFKCKRNKTANDNKNYKTRSFMIHSLKTTTHKDISIFIIPIAIIRAYIDKSIDYTALRCSGASPINSTSTRYCCNSNKHNLNFNNSFNLSWPFMLNIVFIIYTRISTVIYVRINNQIHNYTNNLKLVIEWKLNGQSTLCFYFLITLWLRWPFFPIDQLNF